MKSLTRSTGRQLPLPVEAVAVRLGVSVATVWRIVRRGQLHPFRALGRTAFDPREVGEVEEGRRRLAKSRAA